MNTMDTMDTINNINKKVSKIFENPNINFFIIMMLILLISCYTFINISFKNAISSFVSNPIIILFSLILIILLGYYNINIAVLFLILLFISIYGSTIFNNHNNKHKNNKNNNNNNIGIEGFTDDVSDDESNDNESNDIESNDIESYDNESDDENELVSKQNPKTTKSNYKQKEEDDAKTDETVESIKNSIMGTMNNFKTAGDNEYKQKIMENKQIQYNNEKTKNKKNFKNTSKSNNKSNNKSKKENFQTIELRKFDPNNEEDTNFLITKEILQDMINRIDYNFESNIYLKKYIKHRVEEIVDTNKLLEDEE